MFGYGTWIWHGEQVTEQTTGPDQPEIPKLDKKSLIAGAITIASPWSSFSPDPAQTGQPTQTWDSVQAMNNVDKAALIVAIIVNIWVYVFPLMAAIPAEVPAAFVVRQTSVTISNAVPAGGAIGLGVQYAMLAGYKVSSAAASTGIAITSVWSVFMTLGLPFLGVALLYLTGEGEQQHHRCRGGRGCDHRHDRRVRLDPAQRGTCAQDRRHRQKLANPIASPHARRWTSSRSPGLPIPDRRRRVETLGVHHAVQSGHGLRAVLILFVAIRAVSMVARRG